MPKRGATTTQDAPASKCSRSDAKFAPVLEAIRSATEIGSIGQDTAKMFVTSLPWVLGTAPAERHEVQTKTVGMLEEVMQEVKAKLQECLDEASKTVAELEMTQTSLEQKVNEAEQALAEATKESGVKAHAFADATAHVVKLQAAADAVASTQQQADLAHNEALQAKEKFATVVDTHYKILQAGEFDTENATAHKEAVAQMIEQVEVEESARLSFSVVCVKPISQRTSFDSMVMHAVSEAVEAKVMSLAAKVSEAAAVAKTHASEMEVARAALVEAQAQEKATETAEMEAVVHEKEAKAVVKTAKQEKTSFEGEFKKATSAMATRQEEFSTYVSHNLGCLEKLRDGEASKETLGESACVGGA